MEAAAAFLASTSVAAAGGGQLFEALVGSVVGGVCSTEFLKTWSQSPSLAGATGAPAVAVGAGCVAAGAVAARAWDESVEGCCEKQIEDIQLHAHLRAPSGVDLIVAVRELLACFDWCMAVQESEKGFLEPSLAWLGLASSPASVNVPSTSDCTSSSSAASSSSSSSASEAGGADWSRSSPVREIPLSTKELQAQIARIWEVCCLQSQASSSGNVVAMAANKSLTLLDGVAWGQGKGNNNQSCPECTDPLFDLSVGVPVDHHGILAAVAYVLASFLKHRLGTWLRSEHSDRKALQRTVWSLSRHHLLDPDVSCDDVSDRQFKRGVQALLCLMDASLSWAPIDPFGVLGRCDASFGGLVKEAKSAITASQHASHLRQLVQALNTDSRTVWRRVSVHFDSLRERELPPPWTWVWTRSREASVLIRNHAKVQIRVELRKPKPRPSFPLPCLRLPWFLRTSTKESRVTALIGPGIEWALRPPPGDGWSFNVKLLSEAGVELGTKKMLRGRAWNFRVKTPKRPQSLEACEAGKKSEDSSSVCSTSAPSSYLSSSASSAPSERERCAEPVLPDTSAAKAPASTNINANINTNKNTPLPGPLATAAPSSLASKSPAISGSRRRVSISQNQSQLLSATICPKCLRQMRSRSCSPDFPVYRQGAECDRCEAMLVTSHQYSKGHSTAPFFHCGTCLVDLCHACAIRDLRETWWKEDIPADVV
mmetsp:Transcript_4861/g.11581  ORF Transcript_4861/g.11581 Transcript_4861/m.11581 type:complete len:712 (+) Transcript_4861:58-2193(+)